jgi:hypothetical protein
MPPRLLDRPVRPTLEEHVKTVLRYALLPAVVLLIVTLIALASAVSD